MSPITVEVLATKGAKSAKTRAGAGFVHALLIARCAQSVVNLENAVETGRLQRARREDRSIALGCRPSQEVNTFLGFTPSQFSVFAFFVLFVANPSVEFRFKAGFKP